MVVNDKPSRRSASDGQNGTGPAKTIYRRAEYRLSAHKIVQLPPDTGFEVAFAGRSNAGKSTAINAITDQKSLARTSKTPGRTQQINIFQLDGQRRIADLPGYGYAKVPQSLRDHWRVTLDAYFRGRSSLCGLVLIMDIRHPLTPFDQQMLSWCWSVNLPCHVLLTKADKLKRGAAGNVRLKVLQTIQAEGAGASVQTFSGLSGAGVDEARRVLDQWFEL